MTKNAILFAAIAACLSSGAAMAQSNDHRGERGERYQQQQQAQQQDPQRGDNTRYQQQRRHDASSDSADRNDGHRGDRYDGHRGDRYDGHRGDRRSDYRDHRGDYRDHRSDYRDHRDYRGHNGYYAGRGAGPRYDMRRGGYVSHQYRGSRYVVSDWRRHRGLHAPQRGYHWVQAGNDYLLVAVATGLIAQVLLNN